MAAQKGTRDWSMQMDAGRRNTESRGRRIVLLFIVPVATLLVWQIAVWLELSPPYLLPSPEKVFLLTLPKELADGRIFLHAADSIKRVLLGVALATATGVPLGIVIGYWRSTRDWTSTLINAGRVLPPASLIPIAVVWFGIGDAPAVFLIWFTCVWPILLNTASGVQNVEKILRDGALTLGANARNIVTTVLFPLGSTADCRRRPDSVRSWMERRGDFGASGGTQRSRFLHLGRTPDLLDGEGILRDRGHRHYRCPARHTSA